MLQENSMVDLDDFDPMGSQWKLAKQSFLGGASSEEVADEALRVVAAMLRACGGCSILPQLQDILWEYYNKIASHALWSPTLKEADATLHEKLNLLSKDDAVCDKRIETVALRSTARAALQLRENCPHSLRLTHLRTHLAAFIIKDLIGHSFLDITRAISVGERFATNEQAFQFYEDVMGHIEPGALSMGHRLSRKPTAERLQRYRLVTRTDTTSSLLYDEGIIDCEM